MAEASAQSALPSPKVLEAAEGALLGAGFNACSAGPTQWRCWASLGGWESPVVYGDPLRWDLVYAACRQEYPERFPQ